ncbi:MAG TPA: hypothetical protein PLI06_07245 [Methanofastidiosum sp.]|nr:hypothetical protein [Methanofastidiosum sp.]HNU61593.1 hypothetical protein [Methanofastidiosum sp.]HOI77387.1 hypothetical protein [Methanofastidiosum sp.]
MESDLMEFYGAECPTCKEIEKHLQRLQEEEGIEVTRFEVWHNAINQSIMMKYAKSRCMGVPFLFNKKNESFLCGLNDYDAIKKWAKGEK